MLTDDKRKSLWLEFNVDYETIYAIEAAVRAELAGQEPVAWAYTVNNSHSVFSAEKPPEDAYDEGTLYPLYAAPVVQPDMVLEGFKAACAFIDNHAADPDITSEMRKTYAEFMRMRTMIAAAEGKG